MKEPEKVRQFVAAGVARMVAQLRSDLSSYHAGEPEALEKIARPEIVERITNKLMENLGCP